MAISVDDIERAIDWYTSRFACELKYQDETWALLKFANIHLALVIPEQHPPHIALTDTNAADYGPLTLHRDGTQSIYIEDSEGNSVEIMQA
ncbi:MAG: VOC family protein [Gammaproteobacteria bacterium]|nr:VOC family protein [Gammaproteobacteria bacterium]